MNYVIDCSFVLAGWFLKKPGGVIDWTLTNASIQVQPCDRLVGRGRLELGDGLGALRDGVLRELAREHEPDRSLDLSRGEGLLLGVTAELGGLESDALEDVVDEGVHDGHALLGDAGIRVDLLKDLVDVGAVALGALLLATGGGLLGGLGGLLGALGWCLSHGCSGDECNRTGRVVRAGRGRRAEHSMPERVGGA